MHSSKTIVIDCGHGGAAYFGGSSPSGVRGAAGLEEKALTLDIGKRLKARLGGHRVLMTRESDASVGLGSRARLARDNRADVFLSLHFNGESDPRTQGTESWVAPSASAGSRRLAGKVQNALAVATGYSSRGVKAGELAVLDRRQHARTTAACLVEISYLSDPSEEARLGDPRYRTRLAQALADAVEAHLAGRPRYGYADDDGEPYPEPEPDADADAPAAEGPSGDGEEDLAGKEFEIPDQDADPLGELDEDETEGLATYLRSRGLAKTPQYLSFVEGPPVKPTIDHDHGFLDDGHHKIDPSKMRAPTTKEKALKQWWLLKSRAARTIKPSLAPEAYDAYEHFLNGNGAAKGFDYDKYIAEDPSGAVAIGSIIEDVRDAVISTHDMRMTRSPKDVERDTFKLRSAVKTVGTCPRYPYPAKEKWQKTIGGHPIWVTVSVSVETDPRDGVRRFGVEFVVNVEDMYNFNPGQHDIATGIPDSDNGIFEITGLGHEFLHSSTIKRKMTFTTEIGPVASPRTKPADEEVKGGLGTASPDDTTASERLGWDPLSAAEHVEGTFGAKLVAWPGDEELGSRHVIERKRAQHEHKTWGFRQEAGMDSSRAPSGDSAWSRGQEFAMDSGAETFMRRYLNLTVALDLEPSPARSLQVTLPGLDYQNNKLSGKDRLALSNFSDFTIGQCRLDKRLNDCVDRYWASFGAKNPDIDLGGGRTYALKICAVAKGRPEDLEFFLTIAYYVLTTWPKSTAARHIESVLALPVGRSDADLRECFAKFAQKNLGVDCSGFVGQYFRAQGVTTVSPQNETTLMIKREKRDIRDLARGDILAFLNAEHSHVMVLDSVKPHPARGDAVVVRAVESAGGVGLRASDALVSASGSRTEPFLLLQGPVDALGKGQRGSQQTTYRGGSVA